MLVKEMMDRIEKIIENRVVGVLGHGGSLKILESRIEEFKDLNICWISLNMADLIEEYILSKIDKQLKILFTFAKTTLDNTKNFHIPLISKVINRGDIVISKKDLLKIYDTLFGDFYMEFKDKMFDVLDTVRYKKGYAPFLSQPRANNSMAIIIPFLLLFKPKKIVLFGCDGKANDGEKYCNNYFKPQIEEKRKELPLNVGGDVEQMNLSFLTTLKNFKKYFGLGELAEIVNCTPNTQYTIFRKINYDQLKEEL